MSSTFPSRQESPSRAWWSLPSKLHNIGNGRPYSTQKPSRHGLPKPSGLNFNSIASAIGFKPKKHPSLAIQSPPPVQTTTATDGSAKYRYRPPSKSVSSVRSQVDSLDSRTPVDARGDTPQSLLTLSDVDPFASNGSSARHASDLNRLSGNSNSSIAEVGSKHRGPSMLNRISSSSHSNIHHGGELSPSSSSQSSTLAPDSPTQHLKPTRSVGSLHRKRSIRPPEGSLISAWDNMTQTHQPTISKSGSSSTLTDKNRLSQPLPTPHPPPPMRPRGMTDTSASQLSGSVQTKLSSSRNNSVTSSPISGRSTASSRVISRQTSMSRIGSPPSAPPPRHGLPPPPLVNDNAKDNDPEPAVDASGSSSTLSFASSVSSNKEILLTQPYSPRLKEKRSSGRTSPSSAKHESEHFGNSFSKASQSQLIAPRPLKKALSHQSLVMRGSSSSPASTPATPPPERTNDKVPRKQRSLHQAKSPKSSMSPVRHANTSGSQSPTPGSDRGSLTDHRRDSASIIPIPGRKRLFSGSNLRRPSTAQDDTLSVFSARSEQEQSSSFVNPVSPTTSFSFWDEHTPDHGLDSSRPVIHEYTPKQIMSPAEMAKVEASVEESSVHRRMRGLSDTSASSTTSDGDESLATGPSSPSAWHVGTSTVLTQRSNSLLLTGLTVPRRLAVRPSTSEANVAVPSTHRNSLKSPSSPPQAMTSLPPPPRPRLRPSLVTQALPEDKLVISPSPPIRRSFHAKASVEKAIHRQSLMRKPSFLEIDDDTDRETDGESPGEQLNGSFLDLARESFDTVRSVSD